MENMTKLGLEDSVKCVRDEEMEKQNTNRSVAEKHMCRSGNILVKHKSLIKEQVNEAKAF